MSVELPWNRIAGASMRPLLFSGNQEGSLGGPSLPLPRIGDRFALDVETAQLRQDHEAQLLIAALMEGSTADVRMPLRQPTRKRPSYAGSGVVIDGAGQAGSILALRGGQPGSALTRGTFFNIVHGGVRFVYMVRTSSVIAANGKVALPIWPMLRFLTVDAEPCELDSPMIEGQLVGFDGAKAVRARIEPLSFSIVERA